VPTLQCGLLRLNFSLPMAFPISLEVLDAGGTCAESVLNNKGYRCPERAP
jgi:hypothetical protein